jgi:CheY-like chemotaxis protein
MILPRILSVGKDKTLMASRTLLLSNSGYAVEESHSLEKAICFVEANSIDATVICHTVPQCDQGVLISAVREKRRLMPILPTRTFIQIAGKGHQIKVRRLLEEFGNSPTLRKNINCYMQAFLLQTAQTAACNRLHDIAERLARWLLMCHDRMESDSFYITHEFLGHMLGTPRSTVTLAAGILQKAGLVSYTRGKVNIRDRQGLEKMSCECYSTLRKQF